MEIVGSRSTPASGFWTICSRRWPFTPDGASACRATAILQIDDHHTAEDCALALGEALDSLLGDRGDIRRFGSAHAPLDESLARAVVDLSGRPWPEIHLGLTRERLGSLSAENVGHVLATIAMRARCALHVDLLRGTNDHHRAEAAFKATALALRQALEPSDLSGVASTKGSLE